MKKIQWIFSLLFVLVFMNIGQAQILKKTPKAVGDKADEKTAKAVSASYGKNKVDASAVPNSYSFSWVYSMEIQSDKGKAMVAEYFLEPNAEYFGMNMVSNGMLMIMDNKNKLMVTCFNKGKMASASKIPDYSEVAEKESANTKFTYKTLPNKTFMGFNCKGTEATNENYVMVFYYTNEAKVSFGDMFKSQQGSKTPNAFKNFFKSGEKPLTMYVTIKDLKNKGRTTIMKCVGLKKNSYTFVKSEYKFM
jgi:hypothetical protein